MDEKNDIKLALHDKTGALLMIDKKERRLVKDILTVTLKSQSSRDWIIKRLGKEYIEIGEKLLKSMGGL
jgi:hypothetical protein